MRLAYQTSLSCTLACAPSFLSYAHGQSEPQKTVNILSLYNVHSPDTVSPAAATDSAAKANVNKSNAQHAIVFEAVALALAVDADTEILTQAVGLLGKFISVREPNIKYLGLENMVRLAEVPAVNDTISRYTA